MMGLGRLNINLKVLARRIETDTKLLDAHPDKADVINKHMNNTKELIVDCVMQNSDNPLLEGIKMG